MNLKTKHFVFTALIICFLLCSPVYGKSSLKRIEKPYRKNGVNIVLYQGKYNTKSGGKAKYYAAHVVLSKKAYGRMHIAKAKGKRSKGFQTVKEMVRSRKTKAYNAVLAVNGPFNGADSGKWNAFGLKKYTVSHHNYHEIYGGTYAKGTIGSNAVYGEATYSSSSGLLCPGTLQPGYRKGMKLSEAAKKKVITDTFHGDMGGTLLSDGKNLGSKRKSFAQRTFIGTNGKPGDVCIVVCNGRKSDHWSKGLNGYGEASVLKKLGCRYGYNLDGGGSSTMIYRGKTVNKQTALRRCYDALYVK